MAQEQEFTWSNLVFLMENSCRRERLPSTVYLSGKRSLVIIYHSFVLHFATLAYCCEGEVHIIQVILPDADKVATEKAKTLHFSRNFMVKNNSQSIISYEFHLYYSCI